MPREVRALRPSGTELRETELLSQVNDLDRISEVEESQGAAAFLLGQ